MYCQLEDISLLATLNMLCYVMLIIKFNSIWVVCKVKSIDCLVNINIIKPTDFLVLSFLFFFLIVIFKLPQ